MRAPGLAGVMWGGRGQTEFPKGTANAQGNNLPPITGVGMNAPFKPGPSAGKYQGAQGQLGVYDGNVGNDPRFREMPQPQPRRIAPVIEGQTSNGADMAPYSYTPVGFVGRPLGYAEGARPGWAGRLGGSGGDPLPHGRESFRRYALQGFNDKLTVKDRGAYYDTGNQKTGIQGFPPAGSPNTYNDPKHYPPRPDLRTINRTVSYQKGSDNTAFQDDLTRPYKPAAGTRGFIGEQGSGWIKINGGVLGLYQPYGTRGGVPFPIVSPVAEGAPGDGPGLVFAGPPHGLHTQTPWKGGAQIISRAAVQPQMRPVRIDRPSNSPQAGQSYSQTVRPQGATAFRPGTTRGGTAPFVNPGPKGQKFGGGRGWTGTQGRSGL